MFFTDLRNPAVQTAIKKLCQGHSGVYKITNLRNKKRYIGSAITKKAKGNRLYIRFRNHFFNHHKPFPITRAIKKYGVENFSWEIVEFTEISMTRARETYWRERVNPEYNILQSGESSLGYSHTPETRLKMKTGYSVERRVMISNLNKNKKLSLDVREKLSRAALQRTPELKQKHQQACDAWNKRCFSKPTHILHGETGEVLGTYSSLREACRIWNGDYRTFKRVVKSGKKHHKFNIYVKYIS